MARIAGIDLPKDKRIEIGLTYIYGIGRKSAKDILEKTGVNPDTRVKDLTEAEENKLREAIDHEYTVEGDLRRSVALDIKRLTEIGCYRGIRHRRGDFLLPRKPCPPEEAQEMALPWVSVTVTMVLLKEERIWTWPFSMFFFSRRRRMTRLPVFGAAIFYSPSLLLLVGDGLLGTLAGTGIGLADEGRRRNILWLRICSL